MTTSLKTCCCCTSRGNVRKRYSKKLTISSDKQWELDDEDKKILAKYGINPDEEIDDPIEIWFSNLAYICYIVEKSTNMLIDENSNMIMVFDRYDSFRYEHELQEEARKE